MFDANGTRIGPVVGFSSGFSDLDTGAPVTSVSFNGHQFMMVVTRNQFYDAGTYVGNIHGLYFEGAGCAGMPIVDFHGMEVMVPPAQITVPGHTVYIPIGSLGTQVVHVLSLLQTDGTCFLLSSGDGTGLNPGWFYAMPLVNLDGLYTPPFRMQ